MNRIVIVIFSAIAAFTLFSSSNFDDNGRAGATGSPGETTCKTTNCHNSFALNSGGGSVTATCTMVNWKYEPLTTYSISVKVKKTGVGLFGFGTEILTATNANAGTLSISDATHTQIKSRTVSGISRRNVVHKLNSGISQDSMIFTFNWTSPDTTTGAITMYFCGNAANASGNPNGDYIYSATQVIVPASGTKVNEIKFADQVAVFPNPATASLSVHYILSKPETVTIKLFNIETKNTFSLMCSEKEAGENNELFSIPDGISPGLYIVSIESNSGRITRKLIIN